MEKRVLESERDVKTLKARIKATRKNGLANVVVICGGKSFEHDISILTAQTIVQAVPSEFNAFLLYQSLWGDLFLVPKDANLKQTKTLDKLLQVKLNINDNRLFNLKNKPLFKIDVAVNCSHGQNCEDGTLTHILNLCNIPSTNACATSQAITLDKEFMKDIFVANGFATPRYIVQKGNEIDLQQVVGILRFPIICKPCNLGSSIGICVCEDVNALEKAVALALKYDSKVIFEEYVENALEVNCACVNFNGKVVASACETPQKHDRFLSFSDKYLCGGKNKGKCGFKNNNGVSPLHTFASQLKDCENNNEKIDTEFNKTLNSSTAYKENCTGNEKEIACATKNFVAEQSAFMHSEDDLITKSGVSKEFANSESAFTKNDDKAICSAREELKASKSAFAQKEDELNAESGTREDADKSAVYESVGRGVAQNNVEEFAESGAREKLASYTTAFVHNEETSAERMENVFARNENDLTSERLASALANCVGKTPIESGAREENVTAFSQNGNKTLTDCGVQSNESAQSPKIKTTFCHSENAEIVIDEDESALLREGKGKLTPELTARVRALTEKLYKKFDCDGVVRIDYLINDDIIYVNEINSIPGSLAYYLFADMDISDFVRSLILSAKRRYNALSKRDYYFDTHIC